jgi:viroplasmin and RNaseH domain-containing protein
MTDKKSSKKNWYVVFVGVCPGIYRTWEEARRQVDGYRMPDYKHFDSLAKAKKAFSQRSRCGYDSTKTFNWNHKIPRRR